MSAELATVVASQLGGDLVRATFAGRAIHRDIVYKGSTYLKAMTESRASTVHRSRPWAHSDRGRTKPSGHSGRSRPEDIHDADDLTA
jgi:hypothetical protein